VEPAEVRDEALAGVASLRELLPMLEALGVPAERFAIDPTLARGLDYYTGMVFEISVPGFSGSLGSGGRYDHLIGRLGGPDLPAVGASLGLDRILAILAERGETAGGRDATEVLVTVFDADGRATSLAVAHTLRQHGVRVALYSAVHKLKKQFKYADALGVPWIVIVGPDEAAEGVVTLRSLTSGQQHRVPAGEIAALVRAPLPPGD
jgi:histidyl-tRNA synthetase